MTEGTGTVPAGTHGTAGASDSSGPGMHRATDGGLISAGESYTSRLLSSAYATTRATSVTAASPPSSGQPVASWSSDMGMR